MSDSSAPRGNSDASPSRFRSAVTNGKRLHVQPVGDNAWSRRFRDVLAEIISDLGGARGLSEGQRQLARRAATISLECEKLEAAALSGGAINLETYGQLTDRLGRALQRLGLQPEPSQTAAPIDGSPLTKIECVIVHPPEYHSTEPIEAEPAAVIESEAAPELIPPTEPVPMSAAERLRQHDESKVAWLAGEHAKARLRPPSKWPGQFNADDAVQPYSLLTDWSDNRR
jgi:hypothetical protein